MGEIRGGILSGSGVLCKYKYNIFQVSWLRYYLLCNLLSPKSPLILVLGSAIPFKLYAIQGIDFILRHAVTLSLRFELVLATLRSFKSSG